MSTNSLELIKEHLEKSIGEIGVDIYKKSTSKLKIPENPSRNEIEKLISELEKAIIILYGDEKSRAIFDELHKKLTEDEKSKAGEAALGSDVEREIRAFLTKNALPAEKDITDYAKYLVMKYGGQANDVEKDLVEKVKIHVRTGIIRKKINEEISNFLTRYHEPSEKDINDFINFIRLSNIDYPENELKEQVEKARLFRKFHGAQEEEVPSELDRFYDFVKVSKDKEAVGKEIKKQGLSYLIMNESGVSDKSLSEFIELITPREEDMKEALENLGLDHMVKKK